MGIYMDVKKRLQVNEQCNIDDPDYAEVVIGAKENFPTADQNIRMPRNWMD